MGIKAQMTNMGVPTPFPSISEYPVKTVSQAVGNMRLSKGICTYPCPRLFLIMPFPLSSLLRRSSGTFLKLCSQDNSMSREQLIKVECSLEV